MIFFDLLVDLLPHRLVGVPELEQHNFFTDDRCRRQTAPDIDPRLIGGKRRVIDEDEQKLSTALKQARELLANQHQDRVFKDGEDVETSEEIFNEGWEKTLSVLEARYGRDKVKEARQDLGFGRWL